MWSGGSGCGVEGVGVEWREWALLHQTFHNMFCEGHPRCVWIVSVAIEVGVAIELGVYSEVVAVVW